MPFILLLAGIMLLVVAIRNEQTAFVQMIRKDFSGPGNFFYWVVALLVVGAIGYIPKAKPVSNMLLVLILLVLILSRGNPAHPGGGVFQQLTTALGTPAAPTGAAGLSNLLGTATAAAATNVPAPTTGSGQ